MNIFNNLNLRGNTAENLKIKQAVVDARTNFNASDANTGAPGEIAYSNNALYYHDNNGWKIVGTSDGQPIAVDGSFNLTADSTYNGNNKTLPVNASSDGASYGTQLKVGFYADKNQLIFYTGTLNTSTHPTVDLSSLDNSNIPSTIIKAATFSITGGVGTNPTFYTIDISHNLNNRFVDVSVYRTDDSTDGSNTVWDKITCEIQVISDNAINLKLYGAKEGLNGYYKVVIIGTSSPGPATPGTGEWAQE